MTTITGEWYTLIRGDCLEVMPTLAEVNAVITDPPYRGVLDDEWDNLWESRTHYLEWLRGHIDAWLRALRFNGSLWVFAFPNMAAYVEVEIAKSFCVLSHVVWNKQNGGIASRSNKEELRSPLSLSERIIFAEHYGADNSAKGESGWSAKCDELRGFVFEPLRAYLAGEWIRAGLKFSQANDACGTASMAARHFFSVSQWCLPTAEHYESLRRYANRYGVNHGSEYLRRDYEDLRRDYEDLRRDYEDLRRPFLVTAEDQYGDVWQFNTSSGEGTHHPAQKPIALMEYIIRISTRPGDTILDPFMGSGTTGVAAMRTGRRFIGIELSPAYFQIAAERIANAAGDLTSTTRERASGQLSLLDYGGESPA